MKRTQHLSSSEDSDNGSNSTSWSQHSKSHPRRGQGKKPSEVFRTDLITAMKLHDTYQLNPEDFYVLADPWRQEWEKGVQVPVSPQSIPQPVARITAEKGQEVMFSKPKKLIRTSSAEALGYVDICTLAEGMCRYDLNEEDVAWLQFINKEFCDMGMQVLDEMTMERVMEEFERRCYDKMNHAMETEEGLGIEYDEDVVCDVCLSPDGEDNNEMVFCDKCNICVHQACYGILKVPEGSWLCRICALGILPKCQLCPKKGGAMKPTRSGTKWVHVSCALWIPEVSIGNPEKMEPITNVSHIPSNRWALICCLCKEKTGACIQCSAKNCRTAFHVTCALHCGTEMNTILTEADEVKFKSYCPKHSGLEGSESREQDSGEEKEEKEGARDKRGRRKGRVRGDAASGSLPARGLEAPEGLSSRQQEEKRVNLRKLKLQQLEEEFFQFVDIKEVAKHLKLPQEAVDFLYQYWKLKRRANFNQPLLTPKKDEEECLARREQDVLLRRLQLFTHLRQDLERVRNLTYMVTRREKMKRSLWRVQEQIFQHQVKLLDQELLAGEPSAKCLEEILSLSLVSTQKSDASSLWDYTDLKAKHGSLKQDRGKRAHRRGVPNSPASLSEGDSQSSLPKTEDSDGASYTRLHRPAGRRGLRREAPEPAMTDPDHQEGRSTRRRGDDQDTEERRRKRRSGVGESSPIKTKTRLGSKVNERQANNQTVVKDPGAEDDLSNQGAPSARLAPVSTTTKHYGWPRGTPCTQTNGTLVSGGAVGSHLKNWGKFRIPKRSERPQEVREKGAVELAPQQRKPLHRTPTNTSEPSYPRTRLRTGTETNGYTPEVKHSEPEVEPSLKRCNSRQLRGDTTLSRRYGSDIIRRGVLAS